MEMEMEVEVEMEMVVKMVVKMVGALTALILILNGEPWLLSLFVMRLAGTIMDAAESFIPVNFGVWASHHTTQKLCITSTRHRLALWPWSLALSQSKVGCLLLSVLLLLLLFLFPLSSLSLSSPQRW
jgi:hypothetical protein